MKVVERVLEVTSTLEGEKVAMGIKEDALAHIMSVLTDLYSDPELAVIREYSTNAYDAHVEAGITRPIEVTLPSALAPYFCVRDFGFGLDAEDIREIYSQYGASTKRQSNDVVGMLGLGCKSALTYCDQFTLVGIKDGIATQVAISRDEDGSGSMTIIDTFATDDPSGVKIVVPAKRGNEFEEKAKDFFRFWTEGTVLVNGEMPKQIGSQAGLWIADDLLLTPEIDSSVVVMGNVAYPMPDSGARMWNEWPIVAYVPIGSVQFTPSREQLQMTSLTEATIENVKKRVKEEKVPAYERMINECETKAGALAMTLLSSRIGINTEFQYRGQTVPRALTVEKDERIVSVDKVKRWRRKGWGWGRVVPAESWPKTIWFVNYDGADFSAHKRKKLEQWIEDNDLKLEGVEQFILLKEIPAEVVDWIDSSRVYSWDGPKDTKVKMERKEKLENGRISGSYKGYDTSGTYQGSFLAKDIDTSKPIYYTTRNMFDARLRAVLNASHKNGYSVIIMGANRVNKFKRVFPAAKELWKSVQDLSNAWRDSLTPHDLLALHLRSTRDGDTLRRYDETRVDDPALVEAIKAAKMKMDSLYKEYEVYGRYTTLKPVEWKNPLDSYPLLTQMSTYGIISGKFADHLYLYLNAAYAAKEADLNAV